MSVYVCIWGFLAMLSQVFSMVQLPPIELGPVLKPWLDSLSGTCTATTHGGQKPKNGYKNCEKCGEDFHLSFKPRKAEQGTHISLHLWKLERELFHSRKDFGRI